MPNLSIRTAFNALDQDAFGLGGAAAGGYPASSALGREIAENGRFLWANLRRHHVNHGWPRPDLSGSTIEAKPAKVGLLAGHNVGPWRSIGTPGVRAGEWYVVCRVPAYGQIHAVPYCNHPHGPQPLLPTLAAIAGAFNITNATGSSADKVIGPIPTGLTSGMISAGLVFYAQQQSSGWAAGNRGLVERVEPYLESGAQNMSLVDSRTGSDFAAFAVATGAGASGYAVRVVDAADNTIILTDWHDLLWTTTGADDDANGAAVVYPAITAGFLEGQRIQVAPITTVDLISVMMREVPPSGTLDP